MLDGRAKDLIIRSGHNIDPQMIESTSSATPTSCWRPRWADPTPTLASCRSATWS